jgi:hypothetical protein
MTPLEVYADMERVVRKFDMVRAIYRGRTDNLFARYNIDQYLPMGEETEIRVAGNPAIFHFDDNEWDVWVENSDPDTDMGPVFAFMKEMEDLITDSITDLALCVVALGWEVELYTDGWFCYNDQWAMFVPIFCTTIDDIEVEETY